MTNSIFGTSGNRQKEFINGTSGNDDIYPLGGWDVVQGGAGVDTVFVAGRKADFRVTTDEGVTYVDALSGASAGTESSQLLEVEYVRFSDGQVIDLTLPQTFEARPGMDTFVGNAGIDRAVFSGDVAAHRIERLGDSIFVTDLVGSGGSDRLRNVERLEFRDGKLALDLDGHARDAARLVGVLLGPEALNGSSSARAITGAVLALRDAGKSPADLAAMAVTALALPNAAMLDLLFARIVGRPPTFDETAALLPLFESTPQAALLSQVLESGLADAAIGLMGLAESGLWYT